MTYKSARVIIKRTSIFNIYTILKKQHKNIKIYIFTYIIGKYIEIYRFTCHASFSNDLSEQSVTTTWLFPWHCITKNEKQTLSARIKFYTLKVLTVKNIRA